MAEYLDEAGLTEVWNKATDAFASSDHTHTGYASTSHTHSNATTSSAGFLKALSGSATQFLNGAGNWATPTSSGGATILYNNASGSASVTLSSAATNFKMLLIKGAYYAGIAGNSGVTNWFSAGSYYSEGATTYHVEVTGSTVRGKTTTSASGGSPQNNTFNICKVVGIS